MIRYASARGCACAASHWLGTKIQVEPPEHMTVVAKQRYPGESFISDAVLDRPDKVANLIRPGCSIFGCNAAQEVHGAVTHVGRLIALIYGHKDQPTVPQRR